MASPTPSATPSLHDPHPEPPPQPAVVLSLVAANVLLPKATITALRVVCRATRLEIDENMQELTVPLLDLDDLRAVSTPLTSGLTALRFRAAESWKMDFSNISNACKLAINNCQSLKVLDLTPKGIFSIPSDEGTATLAVLGSCSWPEIRSLSILGFPSIIQTCFKIESMPFLTELRLEGSIALEDVAAMSSSDSFTSRLEILDIEAIKGYDDDVDASLETLLSATTKLRHLRLGVLAGLDLSFLSAVELPSLEFLDLDTSYFNDVVIDPLISIVRPHLRTLVLESESGEAGLDTVPLFSNKGALALPQLENLALENVDICNSDFMAQMWLSTLKNLKIDGCIMELADAARLGAGLTQLPQLEVLHIFGFNYGDNPLIEDLLRALLSGDPHPRLRRLEMRWEGLRIDEDGESIALLAEIGHKAPALEELVMYVPVDIEMIAVLAEAGRAGLWPNLKLLDLGSCYGYRNAQEISRTCRDLVLQAWPGVVFSPREG